MSESSKIQEINQIIVAAIIILTHEFCIQLFFNKNSHWEKNISLYKEKKTTRASPRKAVKSYFIGLYIYFIFFTVSVPRLNSMKSYQKA